MKDTTATPKKDTLASLENAKSIFSMYLSDIKGYHQLTPEEETALFAQLQSGDEKARTRLITNNLRLVFKIAEKLRNCGIDKDDLIQLGNLGLCKAARNFDPTKSMPFAPYAVKCIKGTILNELQSHGRDSRNAAVWEPMPKNYDAAVIDTAISILEGSTPHLVARDKLLRALSNVSQKDREIYFDYLYYPKDMKYITERWNVSSDYVKRVARLCRQEIIRNYNCAQAA